MNGGRTGHGVVEATVRVRRISRPTLSLTAAPADSLNMMVGRSLLVVPLFLLTVAPAHAATRLESRKLTASTDISFVGTGCETRSTRTIVLPETATSVDAITPDIGTDLFTAGNADPIATIRSLDSSLKQVTWIASGANASCLPENAGARWETAIILLKVKYTVRRRVLTRGTVIKRGDAICRDGLAREDAFERRDPNAAAGYAGVAKIVRGTIKRLEALKISKERHSSFVGFVHALDRAQEAGDRAAAAVRRGDSADEDEATVEALTALAQARSAARQYGFRGACRL